MIKKTYQGLETRRRVVFRAPVCRNVGVSDDVGSKCKKRFRKVKKFVEKFTKSCLSSYMLWMEMVVVVVEVRKVVGSLCGSQECLNDAFRVVQALINHTSELLLSIKP